MSCTKREKSKRGGIKEAQVVPDEISEKERRLRFERELVWCIEQLELGLRSSKKADSKQSAEAVRLLKVLRSPSAPLIKKRQVMRNTFGDYRKKMENEEKKYAMTANSISLKSGHRDNLKKAQFLRKSTHYPCVYTDQSTDTKSRDGQNTSENPHPCTDSQTQPTGGFKWTPSAKNEQNTFTFGFSVSDPEGQTQSQNTDSVHTMVESTEKQFDGIDLNKTDGFVGNPRDTSSDTQSSMEVPVNYYKLPHSTNSFRFNFQVS